MLQLLFRQSKLAFGFTVLKLFAVLTFKYLFQIMDCIFFDACVQYLSSTCLPMQNKNQNKKHSDSEEVSSLWSELPQASPIHVG